MPTEAMNGTASGHPADASDATDLHDLTAGGSNSFGPQMDLERNVGGDQNRKSASSFNCMGWIYDHGPWFYAAFAIVNIVVLGMTAYVVDSVNRNVGDPSDGLYPSYLYSDFASTKFLLFASCWSIVALVFIYSCPPHYDFSWTEHLRLHNDLGISVVAHGFTFVFWFAGAVAQAVWLNKTVYCTDGQIDCRHLTSYSKAFDTGIAVLAFIQVLLWFAPTVTAILSSIAAFDGSR